MRKNLFLYLTLACFLGLIAIFIVDGYLGTYDTVYITAREQEYKVEPDYWLRQDRYWSTGANRGEKVFFRYQLDNRKFSQYGATVEVSVWRMQEKVADVVSQPIEVAPFGEVQVEWVLDVAEFMPVDIPPEQSYEFSVIIKRGELERKIILYINPELYPIKPPIPTR